MAQSPFLRVALLLPLGVLPLSCSSGGGGGGGGGGEVTPPLLASVVPDVGPSQGGTSVELLGEGFAAPVTVTFAGVLAPDVVVVSPTRILCTTPAGTGTVDVEVRGSGGGTVLLPDGFQYGALPVIDAVEPSGGPAAGGTLVSIEGSRFGSSLVSVTFGGAPANITNVTDDLVTCLTPAGTGGQSVDVVVTSVDGSATAFQSYTYDLSVEISEVRPSSLFEVGERTFKILGSGFDSGGTTTVAVGGAPATATVVSDSELRVEAPLGPIGIPQDVEVDNGMSSAIAVDAFTSIAHPPELEADRAISIATNLAINDTEILHQDGWLHVAWTEQFFDFWNLKSAASSDGGATWAENNITGAIKFVGEIQLAKLDQHLFAAWTVEATLNSAEVYVHRGVHGGWGAGATRLDDGGHSIEPRLCVVGGRVIVVWLQNYQVALRYSDDLGATWSSTQVLTSGPPCLEVEIAASESSVHVAYSQDLEVHARTAPLGGASLTFGDATRLSAAGSDRAKNPEIVVTDDGLVHVLFNEEGNVRTNRSADDGTSWLATPQQIGCCFSWSDGTVNVAATGSSLLVAWLDNALMLQRARSTDGGQSWSSSGSSLLATSLDRPRLRAQGDIFTMLYSYSLGGNDRQVRLDVSVDAGTTWLPAPLRLDSDSGLSTRPSLALDGARIHAVWTGAGLRYSGTE